MKSYFSNRISIDQIKKDLNLNYPPGDPRLNVHTSAINRIQRLSGFATQKVPNSKYFATSQGEEDMPTNKGQLVIVTKGYYEGGANDKLKIPPSDVNQYNAEFSGDMRLLDGGRHPIGLTFPPIGSLGYFAYNDVPEGWLELKGQGVLYLSSKFYKSAEAGGEQVFNRSDMWDADTGTMGYETTARTEFTPLYEIINSWGMAEVTPSSTGWNLWLPKLQGYFIRSLNPSSSGVDFGHRLWHPTRRMFFNGILTNDSTPTFGVIPVVDHKHYSSVLHHSAKGGTKDMGVTNFVRFWRHTKNQVQGIRNQSSKISQYEWTNKHEYTLDFNFHPFVSSNGSTRVGFPDYNSKTGGKNNISSPTNFVIGGMKEKVRKRYYGIDGYNNWMGVDQTMGYHDGKDQHGWTLRTQGTNENAWSLGWNDKYTERMWGGYYFGSDTSVWASSWYDNWCFHDDNYTWGIPHISLQYGTNYGRRAYGWNGDMRDDETRNWWSTASFPPNRDGYGNESKAGAAAANLASSPWEKSLRNSMQWNPYYSEMTSAGWMIADNYGKTSYNSSAGRHNNDQMEGRYNSHGSHIHNEVWTYWRAASQWWGPYVHEHVVWNTAHGSTNDYHRRADWNNGHANFKHSLSTWWVKEVRNGVGGSNPCIWGNSNYFATQTNSHGHPWPHAYRAYLQWTLPFHIKKSPEGTNDGTEILNTGNDGEPTTTAGDHYHSIHGGTNGIWARGDYENRPVNMAMRLCIKY